MPIFTLENFIPAIHESAWIAPNATVIGKVVCAKNSSIWYGTVLRGDNDWIRIGESSNIQDGSVLHTDNGKPLIVHDRVLVGAHGVIARL
jgi:carbonic anhydrase/acetyltransferase-like protein (isoleucine patch superfamily)